MRRVAISPSSQQPSTIFAAGEADEPLEDLEIDLTVEDLFLLFCFICKYCQWILNF